eukprot:TRINITY_DN1265_c0_g1_i1.p2 TRINITY_DN1265_c0_g1~~TRINITY_DN1265_c0_g1_i1.p2  ORF type:complete len:132 (-),score=10.03 TRINITY_DN1265_c0_g1_i1:505-900(-)
MQRKPTESNCARPDLAVECLPTASRRNYQTVLNELQAQQDLIGKKNSWGMRCGLDWDGSVREDGLIRFGWGTGPGDEEYGELFCDPVANVFEYWAGCCYQYPLGVDGLLHGTPTCLELSKAEQDELDELFG